MREPGKSICGCIAPISCPLSRSADRDTRHCAADGRRRESRRRLCSMGLARPAGEPCAPSHRAVALRRLRFSRLLGRARCSAATDGSRAPCLRAFQNARRRDPRSLAIRAQRTSGGSRRQRLAGQQPSRRRARCGTRRPRGRALDRPHDPRPPAQRPPCASAGRMGHARCPAGRRALSVEPAPGSARPTVRRVCHSVVSGNGS